jgi:DNA modification methylase
MNDMATPNEPGLAPWLNRIHRGDCREMLAQVPDNAVDVIVS